MKIMKADDMCSANAGGVSIITKECKYKKKGCKYVVSSSYNNAWWCYIFTRGACNLAVSFCIDMHNGECVYGYGR